MARKIESKANKYTFVWRKSVERNRAKLMDKIRVLLEQVDESIAQENAPQDTPVEFTPAMLSEIVDEHHRHFFELIQGHYKIYPDRRQF